MEPEYGDDRDRVAMRCGKRETDSKSRNHEAETESERETPAWLRAPSAKARFRALPLNGGCQHCARVVRDSQRDSDPESQAEPTVELPPSARVGSFPNRASRDAGPAIHHGVAESGHNAHSSRPSLERRGSPKRRRRGRNSVGSILGDYRQQGVPLQTRAPHPRSFTWGERALKRPPHVSLRREGNLEGRGLIAPPPPPSSCRQVQCPPTDVDPPSSHDRHHFTPSTPTLTQAQLIIGT